MSAKNLDIAGIGDKGCKVAAAAATVLAELEGKSVRELREIRRGAGIDTSTRSDKRDLVGLIIATTTSDLCCA
jgi:hypothetical protein